MHSPYIKISTAGTAQSEKPSWKATLPRPEKSMHKYLRICVDAWDTERISGSVWSLWSTEFINPEKGKPVSPAGQRTPRSYIAKEADLVRKPTTCPFFTRVSPPVPLSSHGCFDKNEGEKKMFLSEISLVSQGCMVKQKRCFGQVSSFVSLLWHTIESHSGDRKRLLMVSLAKEHFHWKMAFGKLTCFPLALKRPLTEKASPFEILV